MRREFRAWKWPVICVLAVAGAGIGTHAAFAHSGTADEQAACTPDVLSICFWQIPNEDKIVACLNKNIDRLSPECRKVIAGDDDKKSKNSKK